MLFNSLDFAIFLPIVFLLYWFVFNGNTRNQNIFIFLVSYVFYGWWNWKLLPLIIISSFTDYFVGLGLKKHERQSTRRLLLGVSVFINLGILGVFKYYNFFISSFIQSFTFFGISLESGSLKIILPIGISFYTLQTLGYTIDVFNRKFQPTNNLPAFLSFVSFFPQLVAGPIERAKDLLPQFYIKRKFEYTRAVDGCRQILWGFFKKVVIADRSGYIVDEIFSNYGNYSPGLLIFGIICFAFQVYCDFSGYSDIAIGTARLFGINLRINFRTPFFSKSLKEFWRRWHMSLSDWFKNYVYIPLGGSHQSRIRTIRNIMIVFTLSGLWHGADWTYVCWGGANGALIALTSNINFRSPRLFKNSRIPIPIAPLQMIWTFLQFILLLIMFRSESIKDAFNYFNGIINLTGDYGSLIVPASVPDPLYHFGLLSVFTIAEWIQRNKLYVLQIDYLSPIVRWSVYSMVFLFIFILAEFGRKEFIYFQF